MTDKGAIQPEMHEHPVFNGQYHQAVWVYHWVSGGTYEKPPEDCPVVCFICGKLRGNNPCQMIKGY